MITKNVYDVINRVEVASKESPIAVFTTVKNKRNWLQAVFADTATTKERLKSHDAKFVGIFDSSTDKEWLKTTLFLALAVY